MSQVLALRDVHKPGSTRVCTDGAHILTGGADGVIALFRRKGWPTSAPIWARQCHEAAVMCMVLDEARHVGLSCGRDGRVLLHENVTTPPTTVIAASADNEQPQANTVPGPSQSSPGLTTRAVCKLTGEVRCLSFDATHKRIFIGGDSLRCLRMHDTTFDVVTYALRVPHPVISLALSPCRQLLAVASGSSGAVHVTSASSTTTTAPKTNEEAEEAGVALDVVLPNVLSPVLKRDDDVACRMDWCLTAAGLLLLIPSATDVQVFAVVTTGPRPNVTRRGVLHGGEGLTDYIAVAAYPLSAHRFACLMANREHIFVAKVDDRTLAMTRYNAQHYPTSSLTDVCAQRGTGDVVVALQDGQVSLLAKLAPREGSIVSRPKSERKTTATNAAPTEEAILGLADTESTAEATKAGAQGVDDDVARSDRSQSGSETESSASDSSSSADDDDEEEDAEAEEDLPRVVEDLKRTNAGLTDDDRPSRWRDEDPRKVLRDTTRKAQQGLSSRFLDDEADEGSSSSSSIRAGDDEAAEEEEEEAEYDAEGGHGDHDGGHLPEEDDEEGRCGPKDLQCHGRGAAPALTLTDYSFQVGATPVGEEGSCYLAYNSVGYIHSARDATTVHFHDISQPAVRIIERGTILMGTLSPVGAGFVLATDPEASRGGESVDDDDVNNNTTGLFTASGAAVPRLTIYFRTFVALGAQADWRVRLQPGETVRCLAAGLRFLAVSTSRYLRLYSISGLELGVLSKYSRIVAMVGTTSSKLMGAYKAELDPLAVVYTLGTGELYVEVLDVGSRSTLIAAHPLPLTELDQDDGVASSAGLPHHQLQWLGWSEDGPLHAVDTAGVVRMYTESWGGSWVPVYDPRATLDQSDSLWVWGVNDEKLFAYRSSKNDPPYPAASPSGLPTEHVTLFLPLTRGSTSARDRELAIWDHLLRRQIRTDELKRQSQFYTASVAKHDALHDKKVLELFTAALKAQQTTRALDLATTLELRDNVEACARLANAEGHAQLVRRLLSLYEVRVKTKSKRRCPLPLEGSFVSEKERDLLLRKLLLKEKTEKTDTSGKTETVPRPQQQPEPEPQPEPVRAAPAPVIKVEAPTRPLEGTEKAAAAPRRHITFDIPHLTASTATPTATPRHNAKPANPFAKPSSAPQLQPSPVPASVASTPPQHTSQPLPPHSPSPVKSPAAADQRPSSELTGSPPGANKAKEKAEETDREDAVNKIASRRVTFVTKALPTHTLPHQATASSSSSLSPSKGADSRCNTHDPFLHATPEEEDDDTVDSDVQLMSLRAAESTTQGGAVTVDALLGESSEARDVFVSQTASFGEALRKRYRDDERDMDEEDTLLGHAAMLPPTLLPKLE